VINLFDIRGAGKKTIRDKDAKVSKMPPGHAGVHRACGGPHRIDREKKKKRRQRSSQLRTRVAV